MEKWSQRKDSPELPKLPRGMGTLDYTPNGLVRYRKNVTVTGYSKRLSITAETVAEVLKEMSREEERVKKENKVQEKKKRTELFSRGNGKLA